jgi:hypothetical protein
MSIMFKVAPLRPWTRQRRIRSEGRVDMVRKCRAASLAGHCTANRGLKQVISRQEIHQLFDIDISQTPAPAPSEVAPGSFPSPLTYSACLHTMMPSACIVILHLLS